MNVLSKYPLPNQMLITDAIKGHIKQMLCPVHDIHPMIEYDLDGLKIVTCCENFEKQCMAETEELISKEQSER